MLRLLLTALYVATSVSATQAQTIATSDASKHVGEQVIVCGVIAGKHTAESAKGKPTFVDIDGSYPHQVFTVVIWNHARAKVGDFPSSGRVCVSVKIAEYKATPQIVLHDGLRSPQAWANSLYSHAHGSLG